MAYLEVIRTLIGRYNWTLLDEDALLRRVLEAAQQGEQPSDLAQQVARQYTIALHAACYGTDDLERREQAYGELFRYLYRVAYNRWPDIAADITQQALVLVSEQIDRCQSPATFLTFAFYKLRQVATASLRAKSGSPLDQLAARDVLTEPDAVELQVIQDECWQVLLAAVKRLPNPQRQTIALKFLAGLSDEEIGTRLHMKAGAVRVARHRGLAQLRKDRRLRESCIA